MLVAADEVTALAATAHRRSGDYQRLVTRAPKARRDIDPVPWR
jgi:hypothetical protein